MKKYFVVIWSWFTVMLFVISSPAKAAQDIPLKLALVLPFSVETVQQAPNPFFIRILQGNWKKSKHC